MYKEIPLQKMIGYYSVRSNVRYSDGLVKRELLTVETVARRENGMPRHDIIDNRDEKLVDHINRILGSTGAARFAVGYFFLSGLTSIAEKLAKVKELRLLIGN